MSDEAKSLEHEQDEVDDGFADSVVQSRTIYVTNFTQVRRMVENI